MSTKVFNNLARGAGITAVLAMSSVAAQATNINLSVASNFYISGSPGNSPIADLIQAFTDPLGPHSGDTVTVVQNGATGTLTTQITGGNSLGVDLFIAADDDHPNTLNSDPMHRYTSNAPFNYATGVLAFYTNTSGVDVTCATGTCGYNSTTYPDVAIADPSTAPYGKAAMQLLTGRYALSPLSSYVTQYSNINTTFDAVNLGSPPPKKAGFIALSQICTGGSWPNTAGNAYVYPSTDTSVSPAITNYAPIVQAAVEIKINRSRSGAEDALLADFVAYLQDHTVSPQSQMMATLANYCYTP